MTKSPKRVLIVEARFYGDLADEMKAGASAALDHAGVPFEVVSVPGCLEIPAAVAIAIKARRYSGFVALGCVIRGETSHYDHVAGESIHGLQALAVKKRAAIGTGILTVENSDQAWARAARDQGNKGKAAAEACLAVIALREKLLKS